MDELLAPIQDVIEGQIVRPAPPPFIVIAPRVWTIQANKISITGLPRPTSSRATFNSLAGYLWGMVHEYESCITRANNYCICSRPPASSSDISTRTSTLRYGPVWRAHCLQLSSLSRPGRYITATQRSGWAQQAQMQLRV